MPFLKMRLFRSRSVPLSLLRRCYPPGAAGCELSGGPQRLCHRNGRIWNGIPCSTRWRGALAPFDPCDTALAKETAPRKVERGMAVAPGGLGRDRLAVPFGQHVAGR